MAHRVHAMHTLIKSCVQPSYSYVFTNKCSNSKLFNQIYLQVVYYRKHDIKSAILENRLFFKKASTFSHLSN